MNEGKLCQLVNVVNLTNDHIHALLIVTDHIEELGVELTSDLASARLVLADVKTERVREGVWYVS